MLLETICAALIPRGNIWQYYIAIITIIIAAYIPWNNNNSEDINSIGHIFIVKPTSVLDGNNFYGTTLEGKVVRLRLRLMDAPEIDQPHGQESRLHLRKLLFSNNSKTYNNNYVLCRTAGFDDWGGIIVDVYTNDNVFNNSNNLINIDEEMMESVQENMVRNGFAWAMEGGFSPNIKMRNAMIKAKTERRGLWESNNPINPREYRRVTRREFNIHSKSTMGKRLRKERYPKYRKVLKRRRLKKKSGRM